MRLDNITVFNLTNIAHALCDVHGNHALNIADRAIYELESEGMPSAADAWRGVKIIVEDMLAGRLGETMPTIH